MGPRRGGKWNIGLEKCFLGQYLVIGRHDCEKNDLATFEERLIFGIFRDFFK